MCVITPLLWSAKCPPPDSDKNRTLEVHVKYHRNNDLATAFPNPTHLILCPLCHKSIFCFILISDFEGNKFKSLEVYQLVQYREGKNYAKILREKNCDWSFQKEILVYGIFKREKLTCKEEKLIFKHFHSLNQFGSWTWESFWWSKRRNLLERGRRGIERVVMMMKMAMTVLVITNRMT